MWGSAHRFGRPLPIFILRRASHPVGRAPPEDKNPPGLRGPAERGKKTMTSEKHETHTQTTVEQFIAGFAVWGLLMVVYAIV